MGKNHPHVFGGEPRGEGEGTSYILHIPLHALGEDPGNSHLGSFAGVFWVPLSLRLEEAPRWSHLHPCQGSWKGETVSQPGGGPGAQEVAVILPQPGVRVRGSLSIATNFLSPSK